jgi:hypothetical protein
MLAVTLYVAPINRALVNSGGGGCLRKARGVASEQGEGSQHNNRSFAKTACTARPLNARPSLRMNPDKKTKKLQQTCSAGGAGRRLSLCELEE